MPSPVHWGGGERHAVFLFDKDEQSHRSEAGGEVLRGAKRRAVSTIFTRVTILEARYNILNRRFAPRLGLGPRLATLIAASSARQGEEVHVGQGSGRGLCEERRRQLGVLVRYGVRR